MILIKDIKILYVDEDIHQLRCYIHPPAKDVLIRLRKKINILIQ